MLTFTSSGSVADHLVLHPSLATGNFIIKVRITPVCVPSGVIDQLMRSVAEIDPCQ